MAYIGKGLDNGVRNRFIFAATQGQTAFSGADSDGKTLAISDILYTDCFQNGVKLEPTTDYTVTLTSLTLVNAASLNDVVDIVSFDIFAVPDTVPASTGGTFGGGITATTGTFSGNVGIGTSPSVPLHVDGAGDLIRAGSTSGQQISIGINTGGGQNYIYGSNHPIKFGINGTERLRILSSGGITFNGDTAAANALDDYEEGTFTPTLYGSSTAGSPTYSARKGFYTKVGNVVNCTIWLVTSALGGLDGSVKIGALPFTTNGSSDARSTITCGYSAGLAITAGNTLSGWIEANVTYINLTNWDTTAGTTDLDDAEWSDNGSAMISFAYRT
jgi:hypothetical protein